MRLWLAFAMVLLVILAPFALLEGTIEENARSFLDSGASRPILAAGLGGLLALDIVLPVPSSLLSTGAGLLLGFATGTITSFLGMTAGSTIGYLLGLRAQSGQLLTARDLERLRLARDRYGDWMILLFRAVPVLAEASVFFAGLSRLPFRRFLALTGSANLAISAVYAAAGAWSARGDTFLYAFLGAIALPGAGLLLFRRHRRR